MTTFIAFISPAPILGFSYFRRYAKALLEASQFFSISTAVRMLSQLDFGKTMNFSIQYVTMRISYVMMRQTFIRHDENFPGRSPTQWLFMCTASHAATVEISNATGRNVGMAEAVNLFSQEGYSVTYYTIMKLSSLLNFILKPHCQEAIMWNFSDK